MQTMSHACLAPWMDGDSDTVYKSRLFLSDASLTCAVHEFASCPQAVHNPCE